MIQSLLDIYNTRQSEYKSRIPTRLSIRDGELSDVAVSRLGYTSFISDYDLIFNHKFKFVEAIAAYALENDLKSCGQTIHSSEVRRRAVAKFTKNFRISCATRIDPLVYLASFIIEEDK